MTKTIHIISITEVHQDGDIFNVIINNESKDAALSALNDFFEQEEIEGHKVADRPFVTLEAAEGLHTDIYGDRTYKVSTASIELSRTPSYEESMRAALLAPGTKKEETFAEVFLNELNHQPFSNKDFAEALCRLHPTLQQLFFKLVKQCILTRAEYNGNCDERNEASVKFARDIKELVQKYGFPMR